MGSISGVIRSTIGMNWMNPAPRSSRRNRYTSSPWSALAALTVVRAFHSTPWRRSTSQPRRTRSKVGLPPLSTRYASCICPWAVDRQPDQEPVLGQECAPRVIQQRPVGLDRVQHALAWAREPCGQLDAAGEELQPHQSRLPTLVGDDHLGVGRVGGEQLLQVRSRGSPGPSGTRCPGIAAPWTGRSSTHSPGCTPHPSAWTSRESLAARLLGSSAHPPLLRQKGHLVPQRGGSTIRSGRVSGAGRPMWPPWPCVSTTASTSIRVGSGWTSATRSAIRSTARLVASSMAMAVPGGYRVTVKSNWCIRARRSSKRGRGSVIQLGSPSTPWAGANRPSSSYTASRYTAAGGGSPGWSPVPRIDGRGVHHVHERNCGRPFAFLISPSVTKTGGAHHSRPIPPARRRIRVSAITQGD